MRNDCKLEVPVVLITYLKLDTLEKVFDGIRNVQPCRLYHISDAGKNSSEQAQVKMVQDFVLNGVDWPCEVKCNYAETNMGARKRIVSGLDWVFNNEERAIIIEDDVVATSDFFFFCQEMLEKYKNAEDVYAISGCNRSGRYNFEYSYTFSKYSDIWGWATWRRAWEKFDDKIEYWPNTKRSKLLRKKFNLDYAMPMERELTMVYEGENDAWDPQWFLYRLVNNGLEIVPRTNMTENIGLNLPEATHKLDKMVDFNIGELEWPLVHPPIVEENRAYDDLVLEDYKIPLWEKVIRLIIPEKLLKKIRLKFFN